MKIFADNFCHFYAILVISYTRLLANVMKIVEIKLQKGTQRTIHRDSIHEKMMNDFYSRFLFSGRTLGRVSGLSERLLELLPLHGGEQQARMVGAWNAHAEL